MRTKRRATAHQLREAIDRLPYDSRVAMLQGIETNPIIVGAYTSPDGICPMLAAHRQGGRTPLIAFAEAWDAYAYRGAGRWRRPRTRRATERELLVLRCHLEASLLEGRAVAEPAERRDAAVPTVTPLRRKPELPERPERPERTPRDHADRPGEPDRRTELAAEPGWAWTRVVRRLDDYEAVLAALSQAAPTASDAPASPDPAAALAAARAR